MNSVNSPVLALSYVSFKYQEQTAFLTLDQLTVVFLRCHFLLPQDRNLPLVHLTTPHFKTITPRGEYVATGTFIIYTMWALGVKMTTVSV